MFSEGADIPTLDTCIMASPIGNCEQSIGRIFRKYGEFHKIILDIIDENIPVLLEKIEDKNGEVKNNNGFSTLEVAKHDAHIVTPVFGSTRPAVKFTYPTYVPFN